MSGSSGSEGRSSWVVLASFKVTGVRIANDMWWEFMAIMIVTKLLLIPRTTVKTTTATKSKLCLSSHACMSFQFFPLPTFSIRNGVSGFGVKCSQCRGPRDVRDKCGNSFSQCGDTHWKECVRSGFVPEKVIWAATVLANLPMLSPPFLSTRGAKATVSLPNVRNVVRGSSTQSKAGSCWKI